MIENLQLKGYSNNFCSDLNILRSKVKTTTAYTITTMKANSTTKTIGTTILTTIIDSITTTTTPTNRTTIKPQKLFKKLASY